MKNVMKSKMIVHNTSTKYIYKKKKNQKYGKLFLFFTSLLLSHFVNITQVY